MCGRLSVAMTPAELAEAFPDVDVVSVLEALALPRYNVAPTQALPAIVAGEDGPRWVALDWWLTPRWAKEKTNKYATFNARAETVASAPAFRQSFKDRRCLVVASSFYEWEKVKGTKRPHSIGLRSGEPLALAGVWDRWTDRETGEIVDSCAVVTTEPNALMATINDRMPVIVSPEEREVWLYGSTNEARHVMRPYGPDEMEAVEVSTYVNDARNEGMECLTPVVGAGDDTLKGECVPRTGGLSPEGHQPGWGSGHTHVCTTQVESPEPVEAPFGSSGMTSC